MRNGFYSEYKTGFIWWVKLVDVSAGRISAMRIDTSSLLGESFDYLVLQCACVCDIR